jgi:hypothetical protein
MELAVSKRKLTLGQFEALGTSLAAELTKALESEIQDCALPELMADPSTDLWSPPKVDSKTVVKLSPKVKELIGWSLDPAWVQKGGYPTVQHAVNHIVAQIKKHCVAESTTARAADSPAAVASQT